MNRSESSPMLHGPIGTTLKNMTVPMILGMVMMMTFGLVDTFFVGLLGTDQLAAISFTFPVTFTLISLNIGLGIGTSATIARYLGRGETQQAKNFATGALMLSFLLVGGLAFIGWLLIDPIFRLMGATTDALLHIHEYMGVWYLAGVCLAVPMVGNSVLRASGDTKTPSIIMAVGGLINAVLDPILIFGWGPFPAMGIQGAAIATFIAWISGFVFLLYLLAVKRQLIHRSLLGINEFLVASRQILKIGLPAAGANMLTPIAGGIMTAIVATYGEHAVAAWGVGSRLESLASIVVLALSMSLPPFLSQNMGANQMQRVAAAYRIVLRFILVWQLVVFAVLWALSPILSTLFATEQSVASLIVLFLSLVPLGYGFQGVVILTNSSFNALHKPMSALGLSIIRLFLFFIPITYAASLIWGLFGLFAAAILANALSALVAYFWFKMSVLRWSTDQEQSL